MGFSDEIKTIVNHEIRQIPAPEWVTIIKIYSDNTHADLKTDSGEIISYVPVLGNASVGVRGLLLFVGFSVDEPVCIC